MAKDLEQMVLSISADTRQIMRALKKLDTDSGKTAKSIEKRFDKLGKNVNGTFAGLGKGLFGGLAAAFSVREAQKLIDTATRIDNALKVAGLSGEQLSKVYDALFASAQKNAAPLEALVQLYGRASLVQKELGISTEQLLKFTDNVAVALRVSGKSAQESSGALLQLSQALGSGVVRAEEFNSLLEGALPIVQAAANGILEAGGSVAKLRKLVTDGKVSSAAFFKGFQAGAALLNQQVAGATYTVAQGFERLQNAAIDAAKRINDAAGISQTAISTLDALAFIVEKLGKAFAGLAKDDNMRAVAGQMDDIGAAARNLWNDPSFQNLYEFLLDTSGSKAKLAATDALASRAKGIEALAAVMRKANAETTASTKKAGNTAPSRFDAAFSQFAAKKVSLKDNPVADAAKAKVRKNALDREIEGVNEDIRALDLQRQMIGATNFERDRSKALLELTNAAQRAGIKLDADKAAALGVLASKYAAASEAARAAKDRYEAVNELSREFGQLGISAIEGLVDGTKSLNDVLADTLKWLGNLVLKAAILGEGPLAALFGSKSSTGGVGGLMGLIAGGFTGGGGSSTIQVGNQLFPKFARGTNSAPGGPSIINERGGEIVDLPSGARVIPHDISLEMARAMRRSGTSVTVGGSSVIIQGDARENTVALINQALARHDADLPSKVINTVRKAQQGRALR